MTLRPSLRRKLLGSATATATDDATGSYFRYSFGSSNFLDYPKIAVWPSVYFITFNVFQQRPARRRDRHLQPGLAAGHRHLDADPEHLSRSSTLTITGTSPSTTHSVPFSLGVI